MTDAVARRSIGTRARNLLTVRRRVEPRHVGSRPHFVLKRNGDQWGVALIHDGRELHWYELDEARRQAGRLIDLARLGSKPGELPSDLHG